MNFGLATSRMCATILISTLLRGAASRGRHLQGGDTYFSVYTQTWGTNYGAAVIWGPALIRGKTVSLRHT